MKKKEMEIVDVEVGLREPLGLACFPSKKMVCVTDSFHNRVFCFDEDGDLSFSLGNGSKLSKPRGLFGDDKNGLLYVTDTGLHKVFVFDLKGKLVRSFGGRGSVEGKFNYPTNVWVDPETGNVYVTDTLNFRVQVFDEKGNFLRVIYTWWTLFSTTFRFSTGREGDWECSVRPAPRRASSLSPPEST